MAILGSGFTVDDTVNTELFIKGVKMTTVSVEIVNSPTIIAIFKLDETIVFLSTNDWLLMAADGPVYDTPETLPFAPQLATLSSSVGSFGGFVIQITGTVFDESTTDVNLYSTDLDTNLCSVVTITGWGKFYCTVPASIAIDSDDSLMLRIGADIYSCVPPDGS